MERSRGSEQIVKPAQAEDPAGEVREPVASSPYLSGGGHAVAGAAFEVPEQRPSPIGPDLELPELIDVTIGHIDSNLRQVQERLARIEAKLGSLPG
jgi:hypothetical protein